MWWVRFPLVARGRVTEYMGLVLKFLASVLVQNAAHGLLVDIGLLIWYRRW
jgi:hypothetical protein